MPNDIKKRGRDASTAEVDGGVKKRRKTAVTEKPALPVQRDVGLVDGAEGFLGLATRVKQLQAENVAAQDAAIKATGNLVVNQMDRKYPGFLEMFNACKRAFQGPAKECNDIQAQETQVRPK